MLEQPGSWRIRKWDTEPFPEANFQCVASEKVAAPMNAEDEFEHWWETLTTISSDSRAMARSGWMAALRVNDALKGNATPQGRSASVPCVVEANDDDSLWIIRHGASIHMQRKRVLHNTDRPMDYSEEVICLLCEALASTPKGVASD